MKRASEPKDPPGRGGSPAEPPDDAEDAPGESSSTGNDADDPPGTPAPTCDLCGGPVLDRHCKILCLNCGYQRDCSDP